MKSRLRGLRGGGRLSRLVPYAEGAGGILLLTAFFVSFYGRASLLYPAFHPFLVVVLLVAGRYGFVPGLVTALFAIADDYLLFVWQNRGESLRPESFSFLWPSAFLFTGMILGEMRDAGARKYRELETRFLKAEEMGRTAAFERDVLLKAKKELERRIFLEPNAVNDLFDVFRSLEKDEIESLSGSLLSLVVSFAGADRAALYRRERRGFRLDLEGGSGASPREVDLRYAPFVRAYEAGEAVTLQSHGILPGISSPEGGTLRPLGVYPVRAGDESVEALLAVWHAPFEKLVPEFFQTLGMIVERANARLTFLRRQKETQEGVALDPETGFLRPFFFARRAAEELGKALRYGTDLSLLLVTFRSAPEEGTDHPVALRAMREIARALLRDVDLAGLAPERNGVSFALPHTPPAGAAVVSEKLRRLWAEKTGENPLLSGTDLAVQCESFTPGAGEESRTSYARIMRLLDQRTVFHPAARVFGEAGFRRYVEQERREATEPMGLVRVTFSSPSWEDALTLRQALDRVRGRNGGRLLPFDAQAGLALDSQALWLFLPEGTPERLEEIRTAFETLWEETEIPRLKQGGFLFDAALLAPGEGALPPLLALDGSENAEESPSSSPSAVSQESVSGDRSGERPSDGQNGSGGRIPEVAPTEEGGKGEGTSGDLSEAVENLLRGRGGEGLTRRDLAKTSRRFARLSEDEQTALLEKLVREGRLVREESAGRGRPRIAYRPLASETRSGEPSGKVSEKGSQDGSNG